MRNESDIQRRVEQYKKLAETSVVVGLCPHPLLASLKWHEVTGKARDTLLITKEFLDTLSESVIKRVVKVNKKVEEVAVEIARTGVIPGIMLFGVIDRRLFILDANHRAASFRISGVSEAYAEAQFQHFDDEAAMGIEYVKLASPIRAQKPDDKLKALKPSMPELQSLMEKCPFLGFEQIRRNVNAPVVSAAVAIRCWTASKQASPSGGGGGAAVKMAEDLDALDVDRMSSVLNLCATAWGRSVEFRRLWSTLTLTLVMWMYRNLVLEQYSPGSVRLTKEMFLKCLMSISADENYLDFVPGRNLSELNRWPTYSKLKAIFVKRIKAETGKVVRLPAPAWAKS